MTVLWIIASLFLLRSFLRRSIWWMG